MSSYLWNHITSSSQLFLGKKNKFWSKSVLEDLSKLPTSQMCIRWAIVPYNNFEYAEDLHAFLAILGCLFAARVRWYRAGGSLKPTTTSAAFFRDLTNAWLYYVWLSEQQSHSPRNENRDKLV